MKSSCRYFIGFFVILSMVGGSLAGANPLTSVTEPMKDTQTSLTVVFAPAPEFDPVGGAEFPDVDMEGDSVRDTGTLRFRLVSANVPEIPVESENFVGQVEEIVPVAAEEVPSVPTNTSRSVSAAVPEPSTLLLLGLGVFGLLGLARRKKI